MNHSNKNLHRLNILAHSDYTGQVDGILREGRYYPLAINLTITAKRAFDENPMPSKEDKDITSANHSKEGIQRNGGIGCLIP